MIQVDGAELHKISKANDFNHKAHCLLAGRVRGREDINFMRLRRLMREAGHPVNPEDMASLFMSWQRLGLGRIVYGRHGKPNRFELGVDLLSLIKAAGYTAVWRGPDGMVIDGPIKGKRCTYTVVEVAPSNAVAPKPRPRLNLPKVTTDLPAPVAPAAIAEELPAVAQPTPVKPKTVIVRRAGFEMEVPTDLDASTARGVVTLLKSLT